MDDEQRENPVDERTTIIPEENNTRRSIVTKVLGSVEKLLQFPPELKIEFKISIGEPEKDEGRLHGYLKRVHEKDKG